MLTLVLLLSAAVAGPDPGVMMGQLRAQQGRPRMAAEQFRATLARDPTKHRARLGLAGALAAMRRCEEALRELTLVAASPAWGADALVVEAECHEQLGDRWGALDALEEAVELEPDHSQAVTRLWRVQAALGVRVERERELEIVGVDGGPLLAQLATAELALSQCSDDLDGLLDQLGRVRGISAAFQARVLVLDGRRWLQLGDLEQAETSFSSALRASMSDALAAAWLAETRRRDGRPKEGMSAIDRRLVAASAPTPLMDTMRARLLVDLGEFAAAEELLARHPYPQDAETLASRWYVAWNQKREVELLAQRWRRTELCDTKRLEHLLVNP